MRPVRLTAALTVALLATALSPGTAGATDPARPKPTSPVLAGTHVGGRVVVDRSTLAYTWPGVYFEGRFRGTGVGIVLDDADNDYDVAVDGTTVATLVTPGRTTHWVDGLADGVHRVRLVKRTESPWAAGRFGGFVAAPGGAILDRPRARARQVEFVGDSYTAGYGNMSDSRDCTGEQVNRTTNADLGFGALTARRLNADYQVNAFSGRGMVRNYNGGEPGTSYRTYYDRALLNVEGDVWRDRGGWRPQLVVIGLGINDFSTPVDPGEQWTPETLVAAYRAAYLAFLDKLRARYGPRTTIVVSATHVPGGEVFAETARQVVQERTDRVHYWYYDSAGLDYGGCHWHPSLRDHEIIADRLTAFLGTLPLRW
ncbi:SGNH/GDSL hydrolase family protein [Plantactinospora endophytica]|uniref:Lipase n=1 Tax=Plantactinospora endophytica TaxID=673535 RepID=A0ABQ4E0F3_9ACTN|nr:SGNH/GDSL hydrolase family protein [Plantactinospora endophytica]GIG88183.1 lipase [Plantactinospora endophytica]